MNSAPFNAVGPASSNPLLAKPSLALSRFRPLLRERYQPQGRLCVESPEASESHPGADLQRVSSCVEQTELKTLLSEPQEGRQSFQCPRADLA